jgi:2-iminobutanoate/2-iminopropanoate deaminase
MKMIGTPPTTPSGQAIPLSPAVAIGDLLFLSGQVPMRDGAIIGADIGEQTNVVIDLIEAVLKEQALALDNIAKATVWLTDGAHFAGFNAVYQQRLRAPYPIRSTVISGLVVPGALIEIEVMACRTPRTA